MPTAVQLHRDPAPLAILASPEMEAAETDRNTGPPPAFPVTNALREQLHENQHGPVYSRIAGRQRDELPMQRLRVEGSMQEVPRVMLR